MNVPLFRYRRFALGGSLLIFAMAVFATVTGLSNYRTLQLENRQNLPEYSLIESEALADHCGDLVESKFVICVLEYLDERRDYERAELNLATQQDIAFWALVLLLVSGIGLLLSAGSVVALVWTFWRTREQSRVETRAYVLAQNVAVAKIWDSKDLSRFQFDIGFEVRNTGNTPALDLTIVSRIGWSTFDDILNWTPPSSPNSRGIIGPNCELHQSRRIEQDFQDLFVQSNINKKATIWVRGVVRYRDIYDQWWEHTFAWHLKNPDRLLNSAVPQPEGEKFLELGLSMHETLNDLKRVPKPT